MCTRLTEYQIWKLANLVSSYSNLFEVGLALGCEDVKIKCIWSDLEHKCSYYQDNEERVRMTLYNILILLRNRLPPSEFKTQLLKVLCYLGYEKKVRDILDI